MKQTAVKTGLQVAGVPRRKQSIKKWIIKDNIFPLAIAGFAARRIVPAHGQ
jgi:hypothetical protein